jgi:hypothetical protein
MEWFGLFLLPLRALLWPIAALTSLLTTVFSPVIYIAQYALAPFMLIWRLVPSIEVRLVSNRIPRYWLTLIATAVVYLCMFTTLYPMRKSDVVLQRIFTLVRLCSPSRTRDRCRSKNDVYGCL